MNNIPRAEHPRPDRKRETWLCLNGEWDFEIDNAVSGGARGFAERGSLDGKIVVPFCPESSLSGVCHTDFMSSVWYRRDVDIPSEWAGKRVILHVDACDNDTSVYVNGKLAGNHKGGYTPFAFDVTDLLSESGNYITVHAKDDLRSERQVSGKQSPRYASYGCMYTRTTGIWQTVWLEAAEAAHTVSYRAYPSLSDSTVRLDVKVTEAAVGGSLRVNAYYEGRAVGSASADVYSTTPSLTVGLSESHLWEVGKGRLYDLEFILEKDGKADVMKGYFGLREVALTKERGLMINGETVFGRFVLDQGFYPDGIYTAPSDEALVFDIEASMACASTRRCSSPDSSTTPTDLAIWYGVRRATGDLTTPFPKIFIISFPNGLRRLSATFPTPRSSDGVPSTRPGIKTADSSRWDLSTRSTM